MLKDRKSFLEQLNPTFCKSVLSYEQVNLDLLRYHLLLLELLGSCILPQVPHCN